MASLLELDKISRDPFPQYLSAPVSVGSPDLETRNLSPVHPVVYNISIYVSNYFYKLLLCKKY